MIYYKIFYTNQKGGNINITLESLKSKLQSKQLDLTEEIEYVRNYIKQQTDEKLLLLLNSQIKNIMAEIWGTQFLINQPNMVKEDVNNSIMFGLLNEIDARFKILRIEFDKSIEGNLKKDERILNATELDSEAQEDLTKLFQSSKDFDKIFKEENIHNLDNNYTDSHMLKVTSPLSTIVTDEGDIVKNKVKLFTFSLRELDEKIYHKSLIKDCMKFVFNPKSNSKLTPVRLWGILSLDDTRLTDSAGAEIQIGLKLHYLKSPNLILKDILDSKTKFHLDFLRHKMLYGFRLYKTILINLSKILPEGIQALRLFTLDIQMILNLYEPYLGTDIFHQDGVGRWALWDSLVAEEIIQKNMSKLILIYTSNFEESKGMGLAVSISSKSNRKEINLNISEGTFKVVIIDGNNENIYHATSRDTNGHLGFRELYRIHTGFLLTENATKFLREKGFGEHKYLTPDILNFFLSESQFGAFDIEKYKMVKNRILKNMTYGGI